MQTLMRGFKPMIFRIFEGFRETFEQRRCQNSRENGLWGLVQHEPAGFSRPRSSMAQKWLTNMDHGNQSQVHLPLQQAALRISSCSRAICPGSDLGASMEMLLSGLRKPGGRLLAIAR